VSAYESEEDKIVRVTPVGVEKTYNMTMRGPHHNYFINGVLTANSHSVAYAHVAYQTAYLKAQYPEHFYAAVMTYTADDATKIFKYGSELRSQGIKLLPPDINESGSGFTPVAGAIRFGLAAIKGIGQSAVSAMIEAREAGAFRSIYDFAERVGERGAGKRVLESLVCAGAFDSLKPAGETLHAWRAGLHATVDRALDRGGRKRRERSSGQTAMFGFGSEGATDAESAYSPSESAAAWTHKELLANEKAAIGFYVSGHPLEDFSEKIEQLKCMSVADLAAADPSARVRLAGVVSDFTVRNTKKGDRYAYFRLEDLSGISVKCVLWPEALKTKGKEAANDALMLVVGKLDGSETSQTVVCDDVYLLDKARIPNQHIWSAAAAAARPAAPAARTARSSSNCQSAAIWAGCARRSRGPCEPAPATAKCSSISTSAKRVSASAPNPRARSVCARMNACGTN
jgi:DNA polymerase-3 subunit alpha